MAVVGKPNVYDLHDFEKRSISLFTKSFTFFKLLTVLRHRFKKHFLCSPDFQENWYLVAILICYDLSGLICCRKEKSPEGCIKHQQSL